MPQVTKISPQKSRKRVNVYLDDKFGFGLDLETFHKSGLKVGNEYSQERLEVIIGESEYATTLQKLYNYAMLRPRSEKEINDWFYRKKIPDSIRPKLIGKLQNQDLYGDERFARWWVGQRLSFRSKSKLELEKELRSKGISSDQIKVVFSEFEIDEVKSGVDLLTKNAYKWSRLSESEGRKKKSEYLARKGFKWHDIRAIIDQIG